MIVYTNDIEALEKKKTSNPNSSLSLKKYIISAVWQENRQKRVF
jgi:hypothetical protein